MDVVCCDGGWLWWWWWLSRRKLFWKERGDVFVYGNSQKGKSRIHGFNFTSLTNARKSEKQSSRIIQGVHLNTKR